MKVYQARSFTDYQHKRPPRKRLRGTWFWLSGHTDRHVLDWIDRTAWACRQTTNTLTGYSPVRECYTHYVPYVLYGRPLTRSPVIPGSPYFYTHFLGCVWTKELR